ncbi:MAG: ABC transporter ATP-binding protein [Acidimicrobiia bacterium]|nr:ABC transporter ATP-binding protein [Acidimicrobiia bacterium]
MSTALATSWRADSRRTAGVLVLSGLSSLTAVLLAFWLRRIVDAAVAGDERAALAAAAGTGLTAGLGMLARTSVTAMMFPLKEHTGAYFDGRLIGLVSAIATVEHHERPDYLDRIAVLRDEAHMIAHAGVNTAGVLAVSIQMAVTGILLASVDARLLALPLFAIPSFWAGSRAERLRQQALDDTADATRQARHLFELATSPAPGKELRVFGLGPELLARHRATRRVVDAQLDAAARRGVAYTAIGWLAFTAGYAGAVGIAASEAVAGRATVGDVVLALVLVAQVNAQVGEAVHVVATLARIVRVAGRYQWLIRYSAASRPERTSPAPVPERLTDGVALDGVAFRYPGTDADVLAGVDLHIPAGTTVAVIGDNGAGKSTLVKLLCRLHEPTGGFISVDGIDVRRLDIDEWRARTSAAFQDFVRLELAAGRTVGVGDLPRIDDDAAVATALERAASSGVVAELPHGLGTQLGSSFDGGVELSGGQWQKLALARAMMRPSPLLLVLDEPTAALDAETEHALFARYAAAARAAAARTGAITVLVSHRFSTVRMADLIVVLDGGRVAEAGSHDDLVARGGLYAQLHELQARSYR